MEELLNKLIEKGWKPFGSNYGRYEHGCLIHEFTTKDGVYSYGQYPTALREFCAKESLLWQFVCENGMINVNETEVYYFWLKKKGTLDRGHYYLSEASEDIRTNNYEYRVIESALKDESELESFILDNIKV